MTFPAFVFHFYFSVVAIGATSVAIGATSAAALQGMKLMVKTNHMIHRMKNVMTRVRVPGGSSDPELHRSTLRIAPCNTRQMQMMKDIASARDSFGVILLVLRLVVA